MARKRFIQVEDRTPYGEDFDPAILEDAARDSTFIEGYSDVRTQRELDMRDGKRPDPLKHRLQWVRAKKLDNTSADGRRMNHWSTRKGYRTLSYDDAIKLGYKLDNNLAISKGADGLAYLGDSVLMIADAATAAANLMKVQRENEDLLNKPRRDMEAAVERFNASTRGAHAQSFGFVGDDPDEEAKGRSRKK